MNKENIQQLILTLAPNSDVKVCLKTRAEEQKFRDHIRKASVFGYDFCLTRLYDRTFYLEKRQEGDRDKYMNTFKNRG